MQHILVCDDEEDIVAALKIYLEADGYCVHAAYTGADALKICLLYTSPSPRDS